MNKLGMETAPTTPMTVTGGSISPDKPFDMLPIGASASKEGLALGGLGGASSSSSGTGTGTGTSASAADVLRAANSAGTSASAADVLRAANSAANGLLDLQLPGNVLQGIKRGRANSSATSDGDAGGMSVGGMNTSTNVAAPYQEN